MSIVRAIKSAVVTVNGVRVTVEDGTWGLVRASSNKPELVVVVESPVSEARMRDMFKAVDGVSFAIDKGEGCVVPTSETIADGSYPFSRSLYMYVSLNALAENPAVGSYVDLFLSEQGIAKVTEAGYVALAADKLAATQQAWADARA